MQFSSLVQKNCQFDALRFQSHLRAKKGDRLIYEKDKTIQLHTLTTISTANITAIIVTDVRLTVSVKRVSVNDRHSWLTERERKIK